MQNNQNQQVIQISLLVFCFKSWWTEKLGWCSRWLIIVIKALSCFAKFYSKIPKLYFTKTSKTLLKQKHQKHFCFFSYE